MIKLSMSYEEFIVTLFIGPILIASLLSIVTVTYRLMKRFLSNFSDWNGEFERRMEEVERRKKEEGFMHEWVTIKHPSVGELMVCKETGFSPKLYGFFDVKWVKEYLESSDKASEIIKEREDYFQKRLYEIGQKYGISSPTMKEISDEVLVINKQFTIQKLEGLQEELKSKHTGVQDE